MFIIPSSTDAPVYHWPYATVGLIVANVAIFVASVTGVITDPDQLVMPYGAGLTPLQWFTSMFAHADFFHLFGNMVFLWVFGLVVEGKLGWMRFLACYLLIGVMQSVMEQSIQLALSGTGGSLGASSAIYGVMAMAAVWAPKNEVTLHYLFFIYFRPFTGSFEVPIWGMAVFYIGLDVLGTLLLGVNSSSWLHVGGVLIGTPLAIVMLKLHLVDCEGWDIFHVLADDPGAEKEKLKAYEKHLLKKEELQTKSFEETPQRVDWLLKQGNPDAAYDYYKRQNDLADGIALPRDVLQRLVAGLQQQGRWRESCPLMADLLDRFPEGSEAVRVKLAQICLVELDRPGRALELLRGLDVQKLPSKLVPLTKKVALRAQQMQREGHVELDTEQW